jgi:ABC-type lipoprotein release transport system permease subunit
MQIFAPDYREKPSLYKRIQTPDEIVSSLEKSGFKASSRVLSSGLAAYADSSAGVSIRGVQPNHDASVSLVHARVEKGGWLDAADPQGVVIGKRLARTLGVKIGEEVVILTQGADGSMANELYTIRGVLGSVGDATDRGGVFMTQKAFRELMVLPEGAHQIMVRKPEGMELTQATAAVSALAPKVEVKTWKELNPTLASMLESTQSVVFAMFFIVYIAIGLVILNAMLMSVFERIRELGVLKALGMGPAKVIALIITESAVQMAVAMLIAGLLSIPGNWYLVNKGIDLGSLSGMSVAGIAWDPVMRSSVNANTYVGPIVALVCVVFVAVLYPALKAALIRPNRAIQHR